MHQEQGREVQDRGVASRAFVPLVFVGILSGMLVAGRGDAAPADRGDAGRQRTRESAVKVGEAAPDVELARLESVRTEDGGTTGAEEKIKLSSYRGKKPVFLIFTSYT